MKPFLAFAYLEQCRHLNRRNLLFQEFIESELSYFPKGHIAHSVKSIEVVANPMDFNYYLRGVVDVKSCKTVPFYFKIDDVNRFLRPKVMFDPRYFVFYMCYMLRKHMERNKEKI